MGTAKAATTVGTSYPRVGRPNDLVQSLRALCGLHYLSSEFSSECTRNNVTNEVTGTEFLCLCGLRGRFIDGQFIYPDELYPGGIAEDMGDTDMGSFSLPWLLYMCTSPSPLPAPHVHMHSWEGLMRTCIRGRGAAFRFVDLPRLA